MIEVQLVTRQGALGTASLPTLSPPGYVVVDERGQPMLVLGGVLEAGEVPRVLVRRIGVQNDTSVVEVALDLAPSQLLEAAERARLMSVERQQLNQGFQDLADSFSSHEPPLPDISV